ncbi:hypothetical protein DNU06_09695 [Putridiphycobacter roseus]|uniref:DUF6089 domain-containing protein n=1 Tax=Putridiphycobacter roseus TaxID=2219161 RepID=A0A2W1NMW1_9FLAO|nr:DUF6089 family protein [Putridiphycobacter roseus]PZE17012.1 hypothetical protein DNU06_09695 [Putridiphycobacter roseus]
MKQFKLQITILFIMSVTLLNAQTDKFKKAFEFGFFGGGAYYIGDLNPTEHFVYSKPAGGIIMRYNLSTRHSMRFTATYGNVYGDDALSADDWQVNRNLNFSSDIYEVAAGFEICLKKYAINNMKYTFTPYLFYELAYFRMNPKTQYEGNDVFLHEIGTEGQGSDLSDKRSYSLNQLSVPLGVGFKFNLMKRVAVSFEYGIRVTFTDYLDDVSGNYVDNATFANLRGPIAAQLADPSLNGMSSIPGTARGNSNTKDWYAFYGAMITFKPWKYNVCAFSHY